MEAVVGGGGAAGLDAHTHDSDHSVYSPLPRPSAPRRHRHCTLQAAFLERSADPPGLREGPGCSGTEHRSPGGVSLLDPDPGSAAPVWAERNSGTDAPAPWLQKPSASAGLKENYSWAPERALRCTCPAEASTSPVGQMEPLGSEGSRAGAGRRTDRHSLSPGADNTGTARTRKGRAEVSE